MASRRVRFSSSVCILKFPKCCGSVVDSTLWRHRRSRRRRRCCSSSSTHLFSKPPSQRCRWLERWGRCRATPGLQKSGARQAKLHTADRFNTRWPTLTCVCIVVQGPLPVADTQELSRVEGGGFQSFLYTAACFTQTHTHTQKKRAVPKVCWTPQPGLLEWRADRDTLYAGKI